LQAQWTPFSALDLLAWTAERVISPEQAAECLHWVQSPGSWLGLHSLMEASAAPAPLLVIWLAGMLTRDWGRVIRIRAEREIWDERHGLGSPRSESQFGVSQVRRPGPVIALTSAITTVERDILRWLAVNGADNAVNTETAMARHLGRSAAEIRHGFDGLIARRYVLIENGRARLAAEGTTYCVEQGWTMSTTLASASSAG
jgi:hypothetical protein